MVLLTNILHLFDPTGCVALLEKAREALREGGQAVTLEFVLNQDRVSPPFAARCSLTMLPLTPSGDAYTFDELAGMHKQAGLAEVSTQSLPKGPFSVGIGGLGQG